MRNLAASGPYTGVNANQKEIVIHRGRPGAPRWFTYEGKRYEVEYGGYGYGWCVYDPDDALAGETDQYWTLRELREKFPR